MDYLLLRSQSQIYVAGVLDCANESSLTTPRFVTRNGHKFVLILSRIESRNLKTQAAYDACFGCCLMTRNTKNLVGQIVKNIRLSKRPFVTQEQLAVQLQLQDWSINRFGVSKIERGEREVTDFELVKLAKALGVGVEDLFPKHQIADIS